MSVATVQVHALSGGHFSLPEEQFVHPASPGARSSVPSLCFLIQHADAATGRTTRIVVDLGLRNPVETYSEPIRRHAATRQPMATEPDVVQSLAAGGLTPDDIDYVVYSHVHWDHIGDPRRFPRSVFVVGHGSAELLRSGGQSAQLRGGHSFFEEDLLDPERTVELPDPSSSDSADTPAATPAAPASPFSGAWRPLPAFALPAALDVFADGSLYVVDAPGHLPGHINLLAATAGTGPGRLRSWVYLAGDSCHDRRILRGEREIGEWHDAHGRRCCIHADRGRAEETLARIRRLEARPAAGGEDHVEVIFAHDVEWERDAGNRGRFFGAGKAYV